MTLSPAHRPEAQARGGLRDEAGEPGRHFHKTMKQTLEIFKRARAGGLSLSGLWVLVLLDRFGAMKITDLHKHLGVTSAAMTGIIDSLVERKMVFRGTKPGDRRVIMIAMAHAGECLLNVKPREVVR